MKRFLKPLTLAFGLACFLSAAHAADEEVEKVKWFFSYPEALAEARKTGKPIFLEFRCAP